MTTPELPTEFPKDIKTSLDPDDVYWPMVRKPRSDLPSGRVSPPEKAIFEESMALALLLMNEVIFLDDHWFMGTWPEDAKKTTSLNVNCNDVFVWGCADAEEIRFAQLEELYRLWLEFPDWGPAVWCCLNRKEMPQKPVTDAMRKSGIDIKARVKAVQGRVNYYDGVSAVISEMKYEAYQSWMHSKGEDPIPRKGLWWNGWREFAQANPDWYSEEWKSAEKKAIHQWRVDNGFVEEGNGQQQPPVQDPSPEPANPS